MLPFRFAKCLFVAALLCRGAFAQSSVIVYENMFQPQSKYEKLLQEYGDEIIMAGTARVVTRFEFLYFADFVRQGDEGARFRIYKNNGPGWEYQPGKFHASYPTPKDLLWETNLSIFPGDNHVTLKVPYVTVPSTFTWTIEFSGLTMGSRDEAGLYLNGIPTVGTGWNNDFWVEDLLLVNALWREVWVPKGHSGLKNNFACRVWALDSIPAAAPLSVALEGPNVRVSWPTSASSSALESKPAVGGGIWAPVPQPRTVVGELFQIVIPATGDQKVFRLNTEPQPLISFGSVAGGLKLQWPAILAGQTLQGRATLDSGNWVDLPTPSRATGDFYEVTIPPDSENKFFRLRRFY